MNAKISCIFMKLSKMFNKLNIPNSDFNMFHVRRTY